MKYIIAFLLFVPVILLGQNAPAPEAFASTIDSLTLKKYVYTLASKEYEGRETGTEGNARAADFIAARFKELGIPPLSSTGNYFQEVAFSSVKWESIEAVVAGKTIEHMRDYLSLPQYYPRNAGELNINSLTFLGYGIDDKKYSDYAGINVRGKHLLVYGGEPRNQNDQFMITGSDQPSDWSTDVYKKLEAARKAGAASIWIIEPNLKTMVGEARRRFFSGSMLMGTPDEVVLETVPHAFISPALGKDLVGSLEKKVISKRDKIKLKGKSGRVVIPADIRLRAALDITSMPGVNVLAFIEGTDPVLRHEIVVVTAHYDHTGMRGNDIFYGADDNASGTSAVIEIAEAFQLAKNSDAGPRRSVLCMLVTGEEKGLLGSKYYVEHPVFPLDRTVVNVNIDMIGRTDKHHDHPNYIYVIGSDRLSTDLHEINESVNEKYTGLELDYTYNRDDDPNRFYYRSDHYNFAKNGIPAIFFFSGVHEDYHRPTDTPDKINYSKAAVIAKLAFHTAWEVANREERIRVNVVGRS